MDRVIARRGKLGVNLALAVNYSPQAAALVRSARIDVDRFKCPAWSYTIESARRTLPIYVHLPLAVGSGAGHVIDAETHLPADLDRFEQILNETDSPLVNLHIASPADRAHRGHRAAPHSGPADGVVRRLIRDVASAIERFGAPRVALENDFESIGGSVDPALFPETIRTVLDETGAGLLLDLAHAQLAARRIGVDAREYIEALPVDRIREMHVSGVQPLKGRWGERLRRAGVDDAAIRDYLARSVDGLSDHLPMTEDDWTLVGWALNRLRTGAWSRPWIVSYEYGGVGPWFAPVTDEDTLERQIRRLSGLVRAD